MSNKRNRAVLDEDEYIIDEYEYPSDNGSDEDPTQVDSSFYLGGENFSSHGLQENSGSSSMAPGSSNSSAALSSNADFYSNDRFFFIDGVEHQYRDLDLPAEDSRIPVRPPFLAASDFQQEWRYTITDEIKPDCIASGASRGLPIRRRTTTARPSFSPAADIIDVTGDDVPDRIFPQYMDADQVLESCGGIDFASSHSLMGRAFTHVVLYEDLAVGNMVISFNAGDFVTTYPISLENLREPTAQYIIFYKSDDGSSDAVRGYASCHAVALLHPKFLTFLPAARPRWCAPIRCRTQRDGNPSVLAEMVTMYQVTLASPSSRLQLAAVAVPGPLVYRPMESQHKEETLMEKLNALFVLFHQLTGAISALSIAIFEVAEVNPLVFLQRAGTLIPVQQRIEIALILCDWIGVHHHARCIFAVYVQAGTFWPETHRHILN